MGRALIVVPPLIKYTAGPLLGPSLLQSAARNRGHSCSVLDLNAILLSQNKGVAFRKGCLIGDHDKPLSENGSSYLNEVEEKFLQEVILSSGLVLNCDQRKRVRYGFLDHDTVKKGVAHLATSYTFGTLAKSKMAQQYSNLPPPQVIGISLLHAGQVVPAATISELARQLFPDALVVWGGPHVAGLGSGLETDLHQRAYAADVFVSGHAERTFADILDMVGSHEDWRTLQSSVTLLKGKQECIPVPPIFENLHLYEEPLTLPAQSTLGCAYGRCAFCTYPAIESTPVKLPMDVSVGSVVRSALRVGAPNIAIKDSLATPVRLRQIADCIAGQVQWSACTKLNHKLDQPFLQYLRDRGLVTLEVGLESMLPETQKRIDKIQCPKLYQKVVHDVSSVDGLSLVVNYMTGFPWEDIEMSSQKVNEVSSLLRTSLGEYGHLEHNTFELERLSPMMKDPSSFDIDPGLLKEWPWASVVQYK